MKDTCGERDHARAKPTIEGEVSVCATNALSPSLLMYKLGSALIVALTLGVFCPGFVYLLRYWWRGEGSAIGVFPLLVSTYWLYRSRRKIVPPGPCLHWGGLILLALILGLLWFTQLTGALVPQGWLLPLAIAGMIWLYGGVHRVRNVWFPLLFLVLVFPLPALIRSALAIPLQLWSARVALIIVQLFGGHQWELQGTFLSGPDGFTYEVTPDCNGMKSLQAFLIAGLLMARLIHPNIGWFLGQAALILPGILLANSLRIAALAGIGHQLGREAAEGFAHESTGVVIFILIFVSILAIGHLLNRLWRQGRAYTNIPAGSSCSKLTIAELRCVTAQPRNSELGPVALSSAPLRSVPKIMSHSAPKGWKKAILAHSTIIALFFLAWLPAPRLSGFEHPQAPALKVAFYFDGWLGQNLDPTEQELFFYGGLLRKRRYAKHDGMVDLSTCSAATDHRLHQPALCYDLRGWKVLEHDSQLIGTSTNSLWVTRFLIGRDLEKPSKRYLACYDWVESDKRSTIEDVDVLNRQLLWNRLRYRRKADEWTLFSLATECRRETVAQAWRRLEEFTVALRSQGIFVDQ